MIASQATPIPAQLQRLRLQMERAWPETSLGPGGAHQNVKSRRNWTLSLLHQLRHMQSFRDTSCRLAVLIHSHVISYQL